MASTTFSPAPWVHVHEGAYPKRPKKGKKWPTASLRKRMVDTCSTRVAVVGPDFVGCTTLLRGLEQHGFTIAFLGAKPPPISRHRFQEDYLRALVTAWEQLPRSGPALLLEGSPWAYLAVHAAHIKPPCRQ